VGIKYRYGFKISSSIPSMKTLLVVRRVEVMKQTIVEITNPMRVADYEVLTKLETKNAIETWQNPQPKNIGARIFSVVSVKNEMLATYIPNAK